MIGDLPERVEYRNSMDSPSLRLDISIVPPCSNLRPVEEGKTNAHMEVECDITLRWLIEIGFGKDVDPGMIALTMDFAPRARIPDE